MTKVDRVTTEGREGDISPEWFAKRQQCFIETLGLLGVTTRYCAVSNYCDDTDKAKKRRTSVIPEIDAPLLEFMTQVCDPAIRVINPQFTFTGENVATEIQTDVRRRRRPQETEDDIQNERTEPLETAQKQQNEPPQEIDQNKQNQQREPPRETDQGEQAKPPQKAEQNEKTQITNICLMILILCIGIVYGLFMLIAYIA